MLEASRILVGKLAPGMPETLSERWLFLLLAMGLLVIGGVRRLRRP